MKLEDAARWLGMPVVLSDGSKATLIGISRKSPYGYAVGLVSFAADRLDTAKEPLENLQPDIEEARLLHAAYAAIISTSKETSE